MIKKIFLSLLTCILIWSIGSSTTYAALEVDNNPNFYTALYDVVSTDRNILGTQWGWVRDFLQRINSGQLGAEWISDFVVNLVVKVVIPVFALVWIIYAIIWFFRLMSSTEEEELKKGRNFVLRWVIGTLVMISAAWIVLQLVWVEWTWGIFWTITNGGADASGAQLASDIYRKIVYPLIRVLINIIIGILFLIAVGQWFKYLFSGENDEAQSKSFKILWFTVVGILIIILAKTLVESVYGQYETVVAGEALTVTPGAGVDVGKVGDGVFEDPQMEMIWTIINWVLGLSTFVVTLIIIYIGYLLLVQPTNEETTTKLTKAISRALAGILVIWASYLIANFVILK